MALPTNGKVVIETTLGDVEIELWAKETPKTCRNFLALAMEGYYDGVIFHRVVPGFLVQTGDRTGTGHGGESFYGDVFDDEIHPRLRFAHRGLVAMANNGTKNSNDSQFFITLDRADELHGKHTLFGRIVRDTIFNVLKIGQLELGENERPVYPPKIKTIRIIEDPFGDIVPRITAAEKRAQQLAKEASQRQREEAIRRKGAKKNVALLSFGDNAEAQDEPVVFTKKSLSRPDLVDNPDAKSAISADNIPEPPKPRAKPIEAAPQQTVEPKTDSKPQEGEIVSIRKKHKSEKDAKKDSQKTELEKMEAQVRKLARRHSDSESDGEREAKKPKGPSQLELELSKYKKGRGGSGKKGKGKGRDETDVLAALSTFRGRLKQSLGEDEDEDEDANMQDAPAKEAEGGEPVEENLLEVDDDASWIGHRLRFAKDDGSETRRAEHEYEVIDPRARGNQARLEERERKAACTRTKIAELGAPISRYVSKATTQPPNFHLHYTNVSLPFRARPASLVLTSLEFTELIMASKPAQKRLAKEFLAMQKSAPPFVWASPEEKNILHWNFIVRGPADCPYSGGEYHGLIAFPADYPFKPPGIKMYTPSGRFQPDKKICFSMSDFHPGTWNPAWSVATICTGLLSFMLSDEMTTGSVTSTDVEKRDFALRSHEWNRKQKRFRDAFPDYCSEEMKDLPNMGEKDRGPTEGAETTQETPDGTGAPAVRASAPTTAKARAMPTPGSTAAAVAGQVAVAPASWSETIWDRWRWGIFILLAVLVSRLSNV